MIIRMEWFWKISDARVGITRRGKKHFEAQIIKALKATTQHVMQH